VCLGGFCGGLGYCTGACASDADCAPFPSTTGDNPNHCLATTYNGDMQCFAGCSTQADCDKKGAHLTCREVSGVKVCTAASDTGETPLCQPKSPYGSGCQSSAECTCGEQCYDQSGNGILMSCGFPCSTNQDCVTQTGGLFTMCFVGNGIGHCAAAP
jgi:hypothetical protein